MTDTRRWRLLDKDGRLLADLVVTGPDFPWLNARVEPSPEFDTVRPLFEGDLALLNAEQEDWVAWDAAAAKIRTAVQLVDPDGVAVPEFLLHIEGDHAWWRWSDEAFPDA